MKKWNILLLASLLFMAASCSKPSPGDSPDDSGNTKTPTLTEAFTSFKIESGLNEPVSQTINGAIYDSEIDLILPATVDVSNLIVTFDTDGADVYVGSKKQESGVTANDFTQPVTYVVHTADGNKSYKIKIIKISEVQAVVPKVDVVTEDSADIDHDNYIHGYITINGMGKFQDFDSLEMKVKGKGHESWNHPKKPFKIKLEDKASLFGLAKAKKWEFRPDYSGQSLMVDAVAFQMARLLGMPYANHGIPVEVYLNREYMGVYCFTEDKEFGTGRIQGKTLFELDAYYDSEGSQFKSGKFKLPVQVKEPEPDDDDYNSAAWKSQLKSIENGFNTFEASLTEKSFPNNNYLQYFDPVSLVNYLIVSNLTANQEIDGPKSVWMFQADDDTYHFGPVWDYDWAFGYNAGNHFGNADMPLFKPGDGAAGSNFFRAFLKDPYIRALYNQRWSAFVSSGYAQLKEYINEYAHALDVSGAMKRDQQKWHSYHKTEDELITAEQMKTSMLDWLDRRKAYMDANGVQALK